MVQLKNRMMKKYLIPFCLLLYCTGIKAQILSVAEGTNLSMKSGTIFSADSLILTPSADFILNGNSLSKNATLTNSNATASIAKAYKFTNTTSTYSGTVQIKYSIAELNGLNESTLQPYIHNGTAWQVYNAATNNTASHYVTSQLLTSVLLNELSLTGSVINTFTARPIVPPNGLTAKLFEVKAYPNPAITSFHLQVSSGSTEAIRVVVSDINGKRVKELKLIPKEDLEFGAELINGIYIVEIIQGTNRKTIILEKLK